MSINLAITNLGKYNEGELVYKWLELPYAEEELEEVLEEIGINSEYEEYFISDYESDFEGLKIGEYDSIEDLNELAERLESLDIYELEILEALIEGFGMDLVYGIDSIDDTILYSDINDDEDLGWYYVHDLGIYDLSNMGSLSNYIDYESLGRDIRLESNGCFTSKGWIELNN